MKKQYIPKQGDIVWLEFNPQAGHEQAGIRPAITISPLNYNKKVGLALFCPITSQVKGYPFEVKANTTKIKGVVLSDQLKSLDWSSRKIKFICKAPSTLLEKISDKLSTLLP